MAYEVFDSKAIKFGAPQVTIRSGRIAFNKDAGDVLSKTGAIFAHLLWDRESCRLAIQPIGKEDALAFRITFFHGKRGGTVAAQSFLKYIEWKADGPVVLPAVWNERERILETSLPRVHVGTKSAARETERATKKHL